MKRNKFQQIMSIRGMGQIVTVTVGLAVLIVVFAIMNPNFLSTNNISNLLRQIAPFLLIGIGQGYVLITGNVDLSIGSVVGMSCMISATLMTKGINPWAAVLITMVCCLGMGFLSGTLVARCGLPPFIATLGTQTIGRGIAQIVNGNYNTDSIGEGAEGFRNFFYYGKFAGIYTTIFIGIVLWVIFNFLLNRTKYGRHIYAVGSNKDAAKLSGVNVENSITLVYVVSSFCACVVGLIICATSGMGTMDSGMMYDMYGVAAAVIGGISPLGGSGLLLGTIVGASVWGTLQNGLQFAGAPVAIRNILIGFIVIVSVLSDVMRRQGRFTLKKKTK